MGKFCNVFNTLAKAAVLPSPYEHKHEHEHETSAYAYLVGGSAGESAGVNRGHKPRAVGGMCICIGIGTNAASNKQ